MAVLLEIVKNATVYKVFMQQMVLTFFFSKTEWNGIGIQYQIGVTFPRRNFTNQQMISKWQDVNSFKWLLKLSWKQNTCNDMYQIGSKLIIKLPINSTAKVKISELRVKNLATFQNLQGDFLSLELTILQGSNVLRGSEWACGQCRVWAYRDCVRGVGGQVLEGVVLGVTV